MREIIAGLRNDPRARRIAVGIALALMVAFPFFASAYWVDVAFYLGLYTLLGLSLNVILGEVGLFNLGHAAFWAFGAYTTAILNTRFDIPTLALIPISALATAGFAWLVTSPIIHLRGDYLCIVTIALGEIVRLALNNDPGGITGGPNGIFGIDRPRIGGLVINTPTEFYFLVWIIVVICAWALLRLQNSRIGRAWNYIREDELAAECMGVDVRAFKLLAFTLGAALAGVAGNLYAAKMMVVSPESFTFMESCLVFMIVLLGGMGSVPGTLLGALVVSLFPELFRPLARYRMLIFGIALVAVMYFKPAGMWPRRRATFRSVIGREAGKA
ncbi:branched-chain amino acid ABC transporter permease [Candidatus Bipolaricaulota bacterium]|nr:branched-chain amino acid ABC transporter permease [Candidatus Bipolaricaulota bacterium]